MYKLNPLLESSNKRDKEIKNAALLGAGSYGLYRGGIHGIKNNLDKITGVETRFHNTPESAADQVMNQGILSKYASDPNNLTNTILGDRAKQGSDDLVYLAKNKSSADTVGLNRYMKGVAFDRGKTLKVKIPYDEYLKLKRVSNPELMGAKNFAEYFERLTTDPSVIKKMQIQMSKLPANERHKVEKFLETGNFRDLPSDIRKIGKAAYKQNYNIVGKGTDAIKGDISPEFIKGSQHFRKNMGRNNFVNYVKKHPGRFSKGIAGASLAGIASLGGVAYLGKKIYDSNKK